MVTDSITAGKRADGITQTVGEGSQRRRQRVVVVGAGAAGLSAAWLLCKHHDVTVVDGSSWTGGHAHTAWVDEEKQLLLSGSRAGEFSTAEEKPLAVDTGFIVYNETTYPNFTAWMNLLGISTQATDMSFAVSRNEGNFEYAGGSFSGNARLSSAFICQFLR